MATTALTQPTGTEVFNLFPNAGNEFTINGWSAAHIDNDVTNNPKSSTPLLVFKRWKDILTAAGKDHTALNDDTEYPYAWNGVRYGIIYEYLKHGRLNDVPCTDSGWPVKTFNEMMNMARHHVIDCLRSLSITGNGYYSRTKTGLIKFGNIDIYSNGDT